jgi:hypothetical protein
MKDITPRNGTDAVIYLRTDISLGDLAQRLSRALDGTIRGHTVEVDDFDVDLIGNDERASGPVDTADEFLFYPYLVEIEWRDRTTSADGMVTAVTSILRELDRIKAEYVTAADFEDRLPRGGRSS